MANRHWILEACRFTLKVLLGWQWCLDHQSVLKIKKFNMILLHVNCVALFQHITRHSWRLFCHPFVSSAACRCFQPQLSHYLQISHCSSCTDWDQPTNSYSQSCGLSILYLNTRMCSLHCWLWLPSTRLDLIQIHLPPTPGLLLRSFFLFCFHYLANTHMNSCPICDNCSTGFSSCTHSSCYLFLSLYIKCFVSCHCRC